jgi:hypothetical protein
MDYLVQGKFSMSKFANMKNAGLCSCNGDGFKLRGLDLDVLAFADFVTLDDF